MGLGDSDFDEKDRSAAQFAYEKGFSSDERPNGDTARAEGSVSERSLRTAKCDNLTPSASVHVREDSDSDDQLLGQGMLDVMNKYNNSMNLSQEVEMAKPKRRNSGSLLDKLKDRARRTSVTSNGGKGSESIATGTTNGMPFDASKPRSVASGYDDKWDP